MNQYNHLLEEMRNKLPLGESFDVMERDLSIGGKNTTMFFVDGLTKGSVVQLVMSFLLAIPPQAMERAKTAKEFIKYNMPYLDTLTEADVDTALKHLYSGLLPVLIDGYDEIIIVDIRDYPSRSVEEPSKEKSAGSKRWLYRNPDDEYCVNPAKA